MRRRSALLAILFGCCTGGGFALPAVAQSDPVPTVQPRVVLELFTSQGCSSCPPADRLLKSYTGRKDILALTMPVDIWDYLGWKDTFATPQHTRRIRTYAQVRGDGAVYTPQIVVNGRRHTVGSHQRKIDSTIHSVLEAGNALSVPVKFAMRDGSIVIETGAVPEGVEARDSTIWLGVVQKVGTVDVRRGENSGRELSYYNVVRELSAVGMWNGEAAEVHLSKDAVMGGRKGADACVVLIQAGTGGPIIGAAWWEQRKKQAAK